MFAKIVLILGAVIAAFIGYSAITNPSGVLANYGLIVTDANGRNEIRGQYGGFFIVLSGVMIASLLGKLPKKFGLGVFLLTIGGVLLGRLLSLALEGPAIFAEYSQDIKYLYAFDFVLTVLAYLAYQSVRKEKSSHD